MNNFSRIGFILAAAGSAVGLGNIWKFPYITGENGGGAFVLIYLLAIVFVGLTVFIAESILGQNAQANALTAFVKTSKSQNKNWKFAGFMIFTGLIILSFYSVVLGWVLDYVITSFFSLPTDSKTAGVIFTKLISDDITHLIVYHSIISILVVLIVLKGIKAGIEKINLILMPLLALILFGLFLYSFTLDSFSQALSFMFAPNFDKLTSGSILAALGQAFFTLSLGVGVIMTYSASLPKETNVIKSALMVGVIDTLIALIAGIIIFSFLFKSGAQSVGGPGLVFISLPVIFASWGLLGQVIAVAFFAALLFAGITSTVSLVEPTLKFLMEKYNMSRTKGTILFGITFYLLGIVALLSMSKTYGADLTFFGKNAFDWMDFVTTSVLMPLAGIIIAIFVGFFANKQMLQDVFIKHANLKLFNIWFFLIRYVVPIAISIVFLNQLGII